MDSVGKKTGTFKEAVNTAAVAAIFGKKPTADCIDGKRTVAKLDGSTYTVPCTPAIKATDAKAV
jgi:hypothetical protein